MRSVSMLFGLVRAQRFARGSDRSHACTTQPSDSDGRWWRITRRSKKEVTTKMAIKLAKLHHEAVHVTLNCERGRQPAGLWRGGGNRAGRCEPAFRASRGQRPRRSAIDSGVDHGCAKRPCPNKPEQCTCDIDDAMRRILLGLGVLLALSLYYQSYTLLASYYQSSNPHETRGQGSQWHQITATSTSTPTRSGEADILDKKLEELINDEAAHTNKRGSESVVSDGPHTVILMADNRDPDTGPYDYLLSALLMQLYAAANPGSPCKNPTLTPKP